MAKKKGKKEISPKNWPKKKIPEEAMKSTLHDYFDTYREKGYTSKGLKHYLKDEGYPHELVETVATEHHEKLRAHKKSKLLTFLFMAVFLIVILIPVYIYLTAKPIVPGAAAGVVDCGFKKSCFLDLADDCEDALFHQDEDGSIIRYETSGCSLQISFDRFADDEPAEIVEFLGGKRMNCGYGKGDFDRSWTDDFLSALEFCEGGLKNSLFGLKLAQAAR